MSRQSSVFFPLPVFLYRQNRRLEMYFPSKFQTNVLCKFYYDCQTILQTMTFGSFILVRFRGVHSHRSHSDTVAVLSSSVHLAQESRTNHKSNYKISKDTSYMRHSVRRPPPWVWVMPMGAWLTSTNIAHSSAYVIFSTFTGGFFLSRIVL